MHRRRISCVIDCKVCPSEPYFEVLNIMYFNARQSGPRKEGGLSASCEPYSTFNEFNIENLKITIKYWSSWKRNGGEFCVDLRQQSIIEKENQQSGREAVVAAAKLARIEENVVQCVLSRTHNQLCTGCEVMIMKCHCRLTLHRGWLIADGRWYT